MVYETSATYRSPVESTAMPWGAMELSRTFSFFRRAKHAYPVAIQIVDGDPVAQSRRIVNTAHAVEFANIDVLLP